MSDKIDLSIPEQSDLLQALGQLTVAHGNLEMVLVMCVKSIEKHDLDTVLAKFRKSGAAKLRKRIAKAAKREFGDSKDFEIVETLIHRAWCVSESRNRLLHRFWGVTDQGKWLSSGDENSWEALPKVSIVEELVRQTVEVTAQLNDARTNSDGAVYRLAQSRNDQAK